MQLFHPRDLVSFLHEIDGIACSFITVKYSNQGGVGCAGKNTVTMYV